MEFAKSNFNSEFQFFTKGDVNGSFTRPVFGLLKQALPGTFGSFIKWNFTKFLVNKDGKPVARYGPKEDPFSFEDKIVELMNE